MSPVYCLLPDRACIEVRGTDATAFLQGQLSRTIDTLEPGHAPLAGWHDARGRVRALFRVVHQADRWLLWAPREGIEQTIARLKMFVLRARVAIRASDEWRTAMLVDAAESWAAAHGLPAKARAGFVDDGTLQWIRLGPSAWQAIGGPTAVESFEPTLERGAAALAELAEIRLGIPSVAGGSAEQYVAQMLNLDALDALSFDKGCYPGQEVIARVHNLGSVKRRMRRYSASGVAPPAAGAAVSNESGNIVGEVVRAAPAPTGVEILAVIDHAAASTSLLTDGTPLRELPLPYAVPTD